MRLTVLVLLALSVPSLYQGFRVLRPPEVGDPTQGLIENLRMQPGRKVAVGGAAPPDKRLMDLRSARDAAAGRLLRPVESVGFSRCDPDHLRALRRAASDYAYDKVRHIREILEGFGEAQARRAETLWMNPLAVSAEGVLRRSIADGALALDDFGSTGRLEARRLAHGVVARPVACG